MTRDHTLRTRLLTALAGVTPLVAALLGAGVVAPGQAAAAGASPQAWAITWDSQPRPGVPTDRGSGYMPTISGNGRVVSFASYINLRGDGSSFPDGPRTYVRRSSSPLAVRLAINPDGQLGNDTDVSSCSNCDRESALSDDGRTAAFVSRSTNLTPGDTNGEADIFLRDLATGAVTLVSHGPGGDPANGYSDVPQISGDGSTVLYTSGATNIDPGAPKRSWYLYDVATGLSRSLGTLGGTYRLELSGNGSAVVFDTEQALIPSDVNRRADVYLLDLRTNALSVVSVSSAGVPEGGFAPSVSDDALTVSYRTPTRAPRLKVRDLATHRTRTVPFPVGAYVFEAQLSGDGRRLAVARSIPQTSDMVIEVMGLKGQVFYRSSPTVVAMSPSIDDNGSCVAYSTGANEVAADSNLSLDVYTACES